MRTIEYYVTSIIMVLIAGCSAVTEPPLKELVNIGDYKLNFLHRFRKTYNNSLQRDWC